MVRFARKNDSHSRLRAAVYIHIHSYHRSFVDHEHGTWFALSLILLSDTQAHIYTQNSTCCVYVLIICGYRQHYMVNLIQKVNFAFDAYLVPTSTILV